MARSIRQQLKIDIKHFQQTGEKTPLLFLCDFLNESINLSYIVSLYRKSPIAISELKNKPTAIYYRFYRLYKRLQKEGYMVITKPGNDLIFGTATKHLFDLFKQVQNSNSANTPKEKPFALPQSARPERIEAIKITLQTDMLTDLEKKDMKYIFEQYISDINNRIIVLYRTLPPDEYGQRYFFIPYQTRWNSKGRKKTILDKYEGAIKKSLQQYKTAVHLVLTTDPSRHKSLWHANRHFNIALNRFFSFLKKRLGYRPDYIAVYEFTKSGLLHAHILIFGISYLISHKQITKEWEKCGQGSYNYIYSLKKTKNGWQYARQRPTDASPKQTADDYLKKYLKKAQYSEHLLFLYWVFNKRFYTTSRNLLFSISYKGDESHIYTFIGSFHILEIPAYVIEDIPLQIEWNKPPP